MDITLTISVNQKIFMDIQDYCVQTLARYFPTLRDTVFIFRLKN